MPPPKIQDESQIGRLQYVCSRARDSNDFKARYLVKQLSLTLIQEWSRIRSCVKVVRIFLVDPTLGLVDCSNSGYGHQIQANRDDPTNNVLFPTSWPHSVTVVFSQVISVP